MNFKKIEILNYYEENRKYYLGTINEQKAILMINENSSVLVFNTEGITDSNTTNSILRSDPLIKQPNNISIYCG